MVHQSVESKMEMTFYEEQPFPQPQRVPHGDMNVLKRTLTLDLNKANNGGKRQKLLTNQSVLSSPDIKKLKFSDGELEKFIISQASLTGSNTLITPTPTTTAILCTRGTEEQEMYVQGFQEALNALRNSDSNQSADTQMVELPRSSSNSSSSSSSNLYMALDSSYNPLTSSASNFPPNFSNVVIKDEPQMVPSLGSTPPHSPIDMESQEKIKLERKRQRNRLAASKCRRRKLERIAKLEDKVKLLKGENSELSTMVNRLKDRITHLKKELIVHMQHGCWKDEYISIK
nr:PREDICTED: transcription factor AP-1 [Bemisia tabaci]